MCYYIGVEDLVANALIELVEQTGNRTVSFSQLHKYGDAIIAKLKKDNTEAMLIFTREKTDQFFHNCSDVFSITETEHDVLITLKDGISTTYLRQRFRIRLALSLLKAFVAEDVLNKILEVQHEAV